MLLRERSTQEGPLVSVCDADVLGETFENGEAAAAEEVVASLSRAAVANLVGHDAVGVAVEHGFVEETNVLEFDGTVHAQYLRM